MRQVASQGRVWEKVRYLEPRWGDRRLGPDYNLRGDRDRPVPAFHRCRMGAPLKGGPIKQDAIVLGPMPASLPPVLVGQHCHKAQCLATARQASESSTRIGPQRVHFAFSRGSNGAWLTLEWRERRFRR